MNDNSMIPNTPQAGGEAKLGSIPPLLTQVADKAGAMAERGFGALREGSNDLRNAALRTSGRTVEYIQSDPVKSVLMAAVAGAAMMALFGLLARRGHHD